MCVRLLDRIDSFIFRFSPSLPLREKKQNKNIVWMLVNKRVHKHSHSHHQHTHHKRLAKAWRDAKRRQPPADWDNHGWLSNWQRTVDLCFAGCLRVWHFFSNVLYRNAENVHIFSGSEVRNYTCWSAVIAGKACREWRVAKWECF